jgi:flagellin FlaB
MNGLMSYKQARGQVGIGTLIVFIAMVLVAAIAAGVLINTAGFLQAQSEQTGQQSSSQVSDRLQVMNTVGEVIEDTNGNIAIGAVNMTVKKSPGADDIDLNKTTVQYIDDDQIVDLVSWQRRNSDGHEFLVTEIQDNDNSITNSRVLNSQEDRARITLNFSSSGSVDTSDIFSLKEGDQATIEVTSPSGGTSTETLTVPDSLSGKDAVDL